MSEPELATENVIEHDRFQQYVPTMVYNPDDLPSGRQMDEHSTERTRQHREVSHHQG